MKFLKIKKLHFLNFFELFYDFFINFLLDFTIFDLAFSFIIIIYNLFII